MPIWQCITKAYTKQIDHIIVYMSEEEINTMASIQMAPHPSSQNMVNPLSCMKECLTCYLPQWEMNSTLHASKQRRKSKIL